MNDFLQNLRNGQAEKQRPQKTRKSYDNSYHYSNSRFHSYGGGYQNNRTQPNMKRPSAQPQAGNQVSGDDNIVTSMLAEAIENLSSHIETLANNQDYLIKAQETSARMLERQVDAVERILNHLNIAPLKETPPKETPPLKEAPAKDIFENHYRTSLKSKSDDAVPSDVPQKVSGKNIVKKIQRVKSVIRRRKKIVEKKKDKAVAPNGELLGREAIMDIINKMRSEGATFDQVAVHLIELGQPTFSGRGEWHAQTIHRLCNKR
ncbi:MAG: hypothetical protein GY857_17225 [Desulfobacula sp.]|nr:hypothetical protein [Desulfobacula sp.]